MNILLRAVFNQMSTCRENMCLVLDIEELNEKMLSRVFGQVIDK